MKTAVVVSFSVDEDGAQRVREVLACHLGQEEFDPGSYEIRFSRGELGLNELVELLNRFELSYTVCEERSFKRSELESAAALHLAPCVRIPVTEDDESLDESMCPVCGSFEASEDELVVEGELSDAPGLTVVPSGHFLVNEDVARDLINQRISGCVLRGVRDNWGQPQNLFHLLPTHTLPPVQSPPTRINRADDSNCPVCDNGGLSLSSMLYYDAPMEDFKDVNCSAERFGAGPNLYQEVVVSQRLFRLLVDHGAAGLQVEPVVLV